jgi:hypothetical protein
MAALMMEAVSISESSYIHHQGDDCPDVRGSISETSVNFCETARRKSRKGIFIFAAVKT